MSNQIYFRWLTEFEKQIHCRKHIILYGNIHDEFLWRDERQTVYKIINTFLHELGFSLIVRYSPVNGFSYFSESMREQFGSLIQERAVEHHTQPSPTEPPSPEPPANPMAPPPRRNPGVSTRQAANIRILPEVAFGNLRMALSQSTTSVAAIVDTVDMLTSDPSQYSLEERNLLMLLKMCTLESAVLTEGKLGGYRNTIILVASDLARIPQWVYKDNPLVELVQVSSLNKDERRQFALRSLRPREHFNGFFEGDKISIRRPNNNTPSQLELLAEELADLTEGFHTVDLEALRTTSLRHKMPLKEKEVRKLVDFYKFGRLDDPWEQISPERIASAKQELSRSVIGQPKAIEAVTSMLSSARIGLSMSGKQLSTQPKGIFFFVGPTGVGKTELAKALARLLFADESSLIRFDMSEYAQEHAAEKLTGAPPGFVGFEAGGQLTNRVLEQPYSILLFDEIEKATPKVLDKFLQILSDGRLTDGRGQTVYFNQTVIIFTSNIGASDLTNHNTGETIRSGIMSQVKEGNIPLYSEIEEHFDKEVRWYFSNYIGRTELLGRLGDNIVVFDLLRPEFINSIANKFLQQYADFTKEKYNLKIDFLPSVLEFLLDRMQEQRNLILGGRRIKSLLETLIEKPLNSWLFENFPDTSMLSGKILSVELRQDGSMMAKLIDSQ
jgi:energy-coupling factor transporter ATP-binding protein EcfA2